MRGRRIACQISGMQDAKNEVGRMVRVFSDQIEQCVVIDLVDKAIELTGLQPKVGETAEALLGRAANMLAIQNKDTV